MAKVVEIGDPSGWLSILRRMAITQFGKWFLADTVQPVAIVDSSITLAASSLATLFGAPASAGETVAPAAGTRLADTGALPVGNYTFMVLYGSNDGTISNSFRIRRRNAADAADVWAQRFDIAINTRNPFVFTARFSMAASERLVVENVGAGGAATVYQASIFATIG